MSVRQLTADLEERVRRLEQQHEQSQRQTMCGIEEFCARHNLSRSFFYKLKIPYIKVGARSYVLREVEDEWVASLRDPDKKNKNFARSRDHSSLS